VGLRYSFDNRTTGLNPERGRLLQPQDGAGRPRGRCRIRARCQVHAIAERAILREEVTLRASFEGGALSSTGNSHYNDRFFLNSRQMRGFDTFGLGPRDTTAPNNDALGGNYFAVARFEAAFPLGLPEEYGISGGVFYDVGSVWGLDNTAGFGGPRSMTACTGARRSASRSSGTPRSGRCASTSAMRWKRSPTTSRGNFDFTVETRF
jgi:outer membrane protein insertion porin family